MAIQYGNSTITDIKYCNAHGVLQDVSCVFRNGLPIWNLDHYLTFVAVEDDSSVTFNYVSATSMEYRLNDGPWGGFTKGAQISLPHIGDKVQFRGYDVITDEENHFSMSGSIRGDGDVTSITNGVGGNATMTDGCYDSMFIDCSALITAPRLPSTLLAPNCYSLMFGGCEGISAAPELPAMTLCDSCYYMMFSHCTSLERVVLPATEVSVRVYYRMFAGCTSLSSIETHQTTFMSGASNSGWVSYGVPNSGTFRCPVGLGTHETIARGVSACPAGWTVVNF